MSIDSGPNLGKLRWRCRRGTKELDLLLSRFLEHEFATLDSTLQEQFEALLEQPDPQLQAWLWGIESPADTLAKTLVQRILSSDQA